MKALHLMLIFGLLTQAAFATSGGGDGDLGGGPSVTTGALTVGGIKLDSGVYSDIVSALRDRKFNRDLLEHAGFPTMKDENTFKKFKGIKFNPNGSLSYTFERNPVPKRLPVREIKVKPTIPSPDSLHLIFSADKTAVSREFNYDDWRTNWETTVTRANEDEEQKEKAEVTLFESLSDQYGEDSLVNSFETIINTVGAQIETEEGYTFKIEDSDDFDRVDMSRYLDTSKGEFDPDTFGLPQIDNETLKVTPAELRAYLIRHPVDSGMTIEEFRNLRLGELQLNTSSDLLRKYYKTETDIKIDGLIFRESVRDATSVDGILNNLPNRANLNGGLKLDSSLFELN
jgi:hypothetical protein